MGAVYEARHTTIGKRVALKFVTAEAAHNRDAVERFLREARAATAVESPHIVEIFDTAEDATGRPYIVMELLRGESLADRLARGPLPVEETLRVLGQLLRGLTRAHEAGIVHRDLKPDNVFLVDRDGEPSFVKLLDFGISKMQGAAAADLTTLTREGTVLGTPHYMSPEQAQGFSDTDERSDLWAIGAIAYECLTGRLAFSGSTYEQVIVAICSGPAPSLDDHANVPAALAELINHALQQDRNLRVPSAQAFIDGLSAIDPARVPRLPGSTTDPAAVPHGPSATPRELAPGDAGPSSTPLAFDETMAAPAAATLSTGAGVSRATTPNPSTPRRYFFLVGAASVALCGIALALASTSEALVLHDHAVGAELAVPSPASNVDGAGTRQPKVSAGASPRSSSDEVAGSAPVPTTSSPTPANSAATPPASTVQASPPPYKPPPAKPPVPSKPPPTEAGLATDLTLQTD